MHITTQAERSVLSEILDRVKNLPQSSQADIVSRCMSKLKVGYRLSDKQAIELTKEKYIADLFEMTVAKYHAKYGATKSAINKIANIMIDQLIPITKKLK